MVGPFLRPFRALGAPRAARSQGFGLLASALGWIVSALWAEDEGPEVSQRIWSTQTLLIESDARLILQRPHAVGPHGASGQRGPEGRGLVPGFAGVGLRHRPQPGGGRRLFDLAVIGLRLGKPTACRPASPRKDACDARFWVRRRRPFASTLGGHGVTSPLSWRPRTTARRPKAVREGRRPRRSQNCVVPVERCPRPVRSSPANHLKPPTICISPARPSAQLHGKSTQ